MQNLQAFENIILHNKGIFIMDRRLFSKITLGALAGSVAHAQTYDKDGYINLNQESSKAKSKLLGLPSDEAEEEIKVIQSKREYLNPAKKGLDGKAPRRGVCTSLLFFADVHLAKNNLIKVKDFYEKYSNYIDDVIHLGDSVGAYLKPPFSFWNYFSNALNIIGEHDTFAAARGDVILSERSKYDNYFRPYVKQWQVVQPKNAEAEAKCYWHKDYKNNIRIIAIDCFTPTKPQLAWFEDTLKDAIEKNINVAVISHIPPASSDFVDCNFTSIDYTKDIKQYESNEANLSKFVNAVDNFIDNGGGFVSWICGHYHHDLVMFAKSKNKQLVIAMECASTNDKSTDANHEKSTETSGAWEIISVESLTSLIKIARFGNNYDHQMRHKGTFSYNFKTHNIITQS